MLTRELLLVHYVVVAFALQALHNIVNNAKFHVVETSPTLTFLGNFLANIDQLFNFKRLPKDFLSHFNLPKVLV